MAIVCQPLAASPWKNVALAAIGIGVEGLRIVLAREAQDFLFGDELGAARESLADGQVVEVVEFHAESYLRSRRTLAGSSPARIAAAGAVARPRNQMSTSDSAWRSSEKLLGASTQLAMRPETSESAPMAASLGFTDLGSAPDSTQARIAASMVFRHSAWLAMWRSRTPVASPTYSHLWYAMSKTRCTR